MKNKLLITKYIGLGILCLVVVFILFWLSKQPSPLIPQKQQAQGALVANFPPIETPEFATLQSSFSEVRDGKQVFGATWTIKNKLLHEVMEWIEDEYYSTWIVIEPADEPNPSRLAIKMKKDNQLLTFTLVQTAEDQPVELSALIEYE